MTPASPLLASVIHDRVDRVLAGLAAVGLLDDMQGRPHTLLAPIDRAFDVLPWSFERFLTDARLVEARFDLFEYCVVPSLLRSESDPRPVGTLEGTTVLIGHTHVLGRHGGARILTTVELPLLVVHVLDACVLPRPPEIAALDA